MKKNKPQQPNELIALSNKVMSKDHYCHKILATKGNFGEDKQYIQDLWQSNFAYKYFHSNLT